MSQHSFPFFSSYEVFGLLIWMGGVAGETIADYQLASFKRNPLYAGSGQVFDQGLWRYSRHPNYFFEWIVWIGYSVMAISAPFGWLGIISPILILFLLLKVSGVPLTEAHALEAHGEAYRDYQSKTSPFFPWFRANFQNWNA
jgi:steroid 5-alpha reductase family enzyme